VGAAVAIAETDQVMYESLTRGLNFKVTMGNVLTLTPALTITQDELDQALNILDHAIGNVTVTTGKLNK